MTTAIIGIGNLGGSLARHLVDGGESVTLAAGNEAKAETLAGELGPLAEAASVEDAMAGADTVVLAVWLDTTRELLAKNANLLDGKVVVDPSNPIGFDDKGQMFRTLPAGQSAASVVRDLLPGTARYVKGFGSLAATDLASDGNREPRVVLFYATDDDTAGTTVERLIRAAGFEPLKVGGVADAGRIEGPSGDLQGAVLDIDQAHAAVATKEASA
ncbi:MAG TPA: NAD(P)-binding domain-containing protein [Solirubrobacterales bacterium]|nr:NAD(P)-binding domain-containing protein [Solirubrobacterales bacterium]